MDFMRQLEKGIRAGKAGSSFSSADTTGFKTLDRISTAINAAQKIDELYKDVRSYYRKHTTWTVVVEEKDSLYSVVERWIMDELPEKDHRYLVASSSTVFVANDGEVVKTDDSLSSVPSIFGDNESDGAGYSETQIDLGVIDTRDAVVNISGHKVLVSVSVNAQNENSEKDTKIRRGTSRVNNSRITFTCRSVQSQKAVVNRLESLVSGKRHRTPSLWVGDSWGGWNPNNDAPMRSLSSVVLPDGIKEDLKEDIKKFLSQEKRYGELGIPWHRGFLLHGPPGTGKTSLIKALAGDLGLDLWYAPLNDIKEDSALLDLVRRVRPRGILLLEDVDSFTSARDRESESAGVSTSALLNALDGVVTPHGLITIMTTNHIDRLDTALYRSGRADRVLELGLPGWQEVRDLWSLFFPEEEGLPEDEPLEFAEKGLSHAQISENLKSNWEDEKRAYDELMKFVS